jgi:hypothetical protein
MNCFTDDQVLGQKKMYSDLQNNESVSHVITGEMKVGFFNIIQRSVFRFVSENFMIHQCQASTYVKV